MKGNQNKTHYFFPILKFIVTHVHATCLLLTVIEFYIIIRCFKSALGKKMFQKIDRTGIDLVIIKLLP